MELPTLVPLTACGKTTKMFAGSPAAPRFAWEVVLLAMTLARFPACPWATKFALDAAENCGEVAEPNDAVKIGRATCPANPWLPKLLLAGLAKRAIARLFCAFLNSCRKLFSKMFTSLGVKRRQMPMA